MLLVGKSSFEQKQVVKNARSMKKLFCNIQIVNGRYIGHSIHYSIISKIINVGDDGLIFLENPKHMEFMKLEKWVDVFIYMDFHFKSGKMNISKVATDEKTERSMYG